MLLALLFSIPCMSRAGQIEYEYDFIPAAGSGSAGIAAEIFFKEPVNPVNSVPVFTYNINGQDVFDGFKTTYGSLDDIDLNDSFVSFPDGTATFADSDVKLKSTVDLQWDGIDIDSMAVYGEFKIADTSDTIVWRADAGSLDYVVETGSVNADPVSYDLALNAADPAGTWVAAPVAAPDATETLQLLGAALAALMLFGRTLHDRRDLRIIRN
jgi:hypothetical protein